MISDKQIVNECIELAYSKSAILDNDIYESTSLALKDMWGKYGFAKVLAALSTTWTFDKAANYFSNTQTV